MRWRSNGLDRLGILVPLLLICVSVATAQPPERSQRRGTAVTPPARDPAPPRDTSPEHKFVVFKLEHNAAESVVSLLENVLPSVVKSDDLRLAADSRTNSILAAGTDDALQKIETMLRELDVAGQAPRPDAATEVKIFALQHVNAREAAETLRTLYGEQAQSPFQRQMRGGGGDRRLAIAADERANSVIVSGGKDLLAEIEALVLRLDRAQPGEEERQIEVIGMGRRSVPASDVAETLRRLGTPVEVVANSEAIILRGDKESVQQATELLQKVYGGRSRESDDVRLRVIWLVHPGLADEDAADPPRNLEKVLNALRSKAGVSDLKMAAQFLLNASGVDDRRLRATGTTTIRSAGTTTIRSMRTDISLHATIVEASDRSPRLEINIDVTQSSETGSSAICGLNTVLSAPPGHPVVLGMTPIESMDSVFVIELLPPDEPEAADEPAATTPAAP